jgi:hypothetical protein
MVRTADRIVRIGCASGSLIDSSIAVGQLLTVAELDYLIFDYLSEASMAIFGKLMAANPQAGFASDLLEVQLGPHLGELAARRIKVVANAGALNPRGLAAAIERRASELGLALRVAAVEGDNLLPLVPQLRAEDVREMFSGAAFPRQIVSINAYLGALPISAALDAGADIVVTGRVVDSALALGPLIHEFRWQCDDYARLAGGSVAGHLLECGAQVTGGTFTDWRSVPDWAHIGFPVGECRADGSLVLTKPPGSGGLVSVGTVSEQLLYEVSDPRCYVLPDVICDLTAVHLEQVGPDRVNVSGARGHAPSSTYKVCVTFDDGWRSVALQPVIGIDAGAKALRQANAILERTREVLRQRGLDDFRVAHVEVLGAEAGYGARARIRDPREVIGRIVVEHADRRATDLFWREQNTAIMNMSVGTTIPLAVSAPPSVPVTALFSFLIDKTRVPVTYTLEGSSHAVAVPTAGGFEPPRLPKSAPADSLEPTQSAADAVVPLVALAWARSGEKGNLFNVAVIARHPDYLPHIRAALGSDALAAWYRHFLPAERRACVEAFEVPGIHALNFVVHESMAGGINSSPRLDAGAKGMAQQLLEFPVPVPRAIADRALHA